MGQVWEWLSEAEDTTFGEKWKQLAVMLLALLDHYGDHCVGWDENGEAVGWLAGMM